MAEFKVKSAFGKSREFQTNERTFLAWLRTSIALMGFGFVIVKFSLFLREISMMLETKEGISKGYSAMVGVIMVILGVIITVLAFLQYKKHEKQLNHDIYVSSSKLSLFITIIILIGGIVLISYLFSII